MAPIGPDKHDSRLAQQETAILVTIAHNDRRPLGKRFMLQLMLYVEDKYRIRTGKLGRCHRCGSQMNVYIRAERVE